MANINDLIYNALVAMGYSGPIDSMRLARFLDEGAKSTNINEAQREWLILKGAPPRLPINEMWAYVLRKNGYSGHISEMYYDFWAQGGTFGAAPSAFTVGMWSVGDKGTDGEVDVTINSLPDKGTEDITNIEYSLNGGFWIPSGGTSSFTISGINNGQEYTVNIRAVSSVGAGPTSDTKTVTPTSVPEAFGDSDWSVSDANTDGTLSVTINSLPFDNGRTITDIEYRLDSGSWVSSGGTVSFDITSLVNDQEYTVYIRAVNALGEAVASSGKVGTPTKLTGIPDAFAGEEWAVSDMGDGTGLFVTINSLPNDNGATITDVEYSLDGGSWVSSGGTSSFLISSLDDGTEYSVRIRAVNSVGPGSASSAKTATSTNVPEEFTTGMWTVTDKGTGGAVEVTINLLPFNGGKTITDIEYSVDSGSWTSSEGTSSFQIGGLDNGTEYDIRIRAVNSNGDGPASTVKSVTPTGLPSAFISGDWSVNDKGTDGAITVTINTLPDNGGKTITDVEYRIGSGGSWVSSGGTSSFDITGLTNGSQVSVYIRAVNVNGEGPASGSKSVTPTSVPEAFTSGDWSLSDKTTGGTLEVTINSLPNGNGKTVTGVDYRLDGGSWVSSGGVVSFDITGLTDDQEYDVELRAVNANGAGPAGDTKSETPTEAISAPVFSGTVPTLNFYKDVEITPVDFSTYFTGDDITYSFLGGLPSGLSFNSSTGILSGTPDTEASNTGKSVRATNSAGSDDTNTFTVNVAAATGRSEGVTVGYTAATSADYYVASDGSDSNNGSIGAPFATIRKAAEELDGTGGTIAVRGGTYRQSESLSGLSFPSGLTIHRYGDEVPWFSGAEVLTGLTPCDASDATLLGDAWENCYKADIPAGDLSGSIPPAALNLHEAGEPLGLATDKATVEDDIFTEDMHNFHLADNFNDSGGSITQIQDASVFGKYTSAQLTNATAAVYVSGNWVESQQITNYNGSNTITISGTGAARYANSSMWLYALENMAANIQPGQWAYKATLNGNGSRTVYVYPNNPANITSGIEFSKRTHGIDTSNASKVTIDGVYARQQAGTNNLTCVGIGKLTNATTPTTDITLKQVMVKGLSCNVLGYGAFHFNSVTGLKLEHCSAENLRNTNGYLINGCEDVEIMDCDLYRCSTTPIRVYASEKVAIAYTAFRYGGRAGHSNKIEIYLGNDKVLLYGVRWDDYMGYATHQQSSNIFVGMCEIPGDRRPAYGVVSKGNYAYKDQNYGGEPDTSGVLDLWNNFMPPNPDNLTASGGTLYLGESGSNLDIYDVNNITGGGGDINSGMSKTVLRKNNLLTHAASFQNTDASDLLDTNLANTYVDAANGDFTPKPGGNIFTKAGYNYASGVAARAAAAFPGFDFSLDFNKAALNWSAPSIGHINRTPTEPEAPEYTGSVSNLNYTEGVAITPVDFSTKFSGGTPTSYAISATPPAGLSFNTSTGVLSGTPTDADDDVTGLYVTATNAEGSDSTDTFNITIEEASGYVDTFVRGAYGTLHESATSDGKSSWTVEYGNVRTVSPGAAENTNLDEDSGGVLDDAPASADIVVSVTVTTGGTYGGFNVFARRNPAGNSFYYGGVYYDDNTSAYRMYLGKEVSGIETSLGEISIGASIAAGTVFSLTCNASNISMTWTGGAQEVSVTDSSVQDAGAVGFYIYQFDAPRLQFTKFEVVEL